MFRDRRFFVLAAATAVSFAAAAVFSRDANSDPETEASATYAGRGDDVVAISKPDERLPALLVVLGNRDRRPFAVVARDSSGNRIGALIDTEEPYVGIVPVDLPPTTSTTELEIRATGSWRVNVFPLGMAHKLFVPGTRGGEGDNVLWVVGRPSRATIRGNAASRPFAVIAWDRYGNRLGTLVDTTVPYSGTVTAPEQTLLLQVNAVGGWTVDLR